MLVTLICWGHRRRARLSVTRAVPVCLPERRADQLFDPDDLFSGHARLCECHAYRRRYLCDPDEVPAWTRPLSCHRANRGYRPGVLVHPCEYPGGRGECHECRFGCPGDLDADLCLSVPPRRLLRITQ